MEVDIVKTVKFTAKVCSLYLIPQFLENIIPLEKAEITWDGFKGDKHSSRTSIARIQERNANLVEKGTEIFNLRQITIISKEEIDTIANELGLKNIPFETHNPNIVIEGIKDFTKLPFGTRLQFPQSTILCLADQNYPCTITGGKIQKHYSGNKNIVADYIKTAIKQRGRTAFVLRPGFIKLNDEIKIF